MTNRLSIPFRLAIIYEFSHFSSYQVWTTAPYPFHVGLDRWICHERVVVLYQSVEPTIEWYTKKLLTIGTHHVNDERVVVRIQSMPDCCRRIWFQLQLKSVLDVVYEYHILGQLAVNLEFDFRLNAFRVYGVNQVCCYSPRS